MDKQDLLGRWYGKEPSRYIQTIPTQATAYKLYVIDINADIGRITYDSFIQMDENVIASKVNRTASLVEFEHEVEIGNLYR